MAEYGNGFNCKFGSSKNQTSTCKKKQRASKEANHVWAPLKRRKAPRDNPEAAALKRWSVSEASPQRAERRMLQLQRVQPRNWSPSLVHMPNVSDCEARAFALRMFYIEVSNGMSPTDAQTNVSQMFFGMLKNGPKMGRAVGKYWRRGLAGWSQGAPCLTVLPSNYYSIYISCFTARDSNSLAALSAIVAFVLLLLRNLLR